MDPVAGTFPPIRDVNDAPPPVRPAPAGLHALFAAQASRNPDAAAVVCGSEVLTYGVLATWVSRIAARLCEAGVEADALVGIYMDRRPGMIAAIFATLEVGAAYVPLDPLYPRERLRAMWDQIRSPVLLTQPYLLGSLPFTPPPIVLLPDRERGPAGPGEMAPPGPGREEPDGASYVIFTSGSTGEPKGILVTQRGLCSQLQASQRLFGLGVGDHVLQFASPSFDAAVWEIFIALTTGATLCLTGAGAPPVENLRQLLVEQEITFTHQTPTLLRQVSAEALPALRTVVSAGEACSADIVRRWAPGRRLFNCYGPSEITVVATGGRLEPDEPGPLSMGREMESYRIHLLDDQLAPTRPGDTAEIFIGGPGVARGYLHRPDLTAERFLPDPYSAEPGARLYRTGDLGLRRPDHRLEFAGRTDHQVKIRGVRVEPGEVEAALRAHPAVRDAVVIVHGEGGGDLRLVAYLAAGRGCPSGPELRQFLRRSLPDAMIPMAFVRLDVLPMTSNAKVDRAALPAPELALAGAGHGGRAWRWRSRGAARPCDALERELAALWEELLGRPVGLNDDFFDLGGHSITAVRLVARLEKRLRVPLSLAMLLEAPTVKQLAARLREGIGLGSLLVAIQPWGDRPPLFFTHGADGSVFYYRRLADHVGLKRPFYGLQAPPGGQLPASCEELAARYVAEVRAVQAHGPYFLGGYCAGGTMAFEMARQLRAAGQEVGLLALIDTCDWSRIVPGPLHERLAYFLQKLEFHRRNTLLLPVGERAVFLRGKAQWAAGLVAAWRGRRQNWDGRDPDGAVKRLIMQYVPGFYPGRLIQFRSRAAYDRYCGCELRAGVHAEAIEVEELPVYPGGPLVEPFVRLLAERIRARLDAAGA